MSINRIQPGKRLSAAVVHGDTIYIAGQIAGDAATDVKGQTQQILKKFDELLAAAGSNKSKLLSATIWLADMTSPRAGRRTTPSPGRASRASSAPGSACRKPRRTRWPGSSSTIY